MHSVNPYEDIPYVRGSYIIEKIDCEKDSLTTIFKKDEYEITRDANRAIFPQDSYDYPVFKFKNDSLCLHFDTVLVEITALSPVRSRIERHGSTFYASGHYFKNNQEYIINDNYSFIIKKKIDDETAFSLVIDYKLNQDSYIYRYHVQIDFTERLVYSQNNSRYSKYVYKENYIQ